MAKKYRQRHTAAQTSGPRDSAVVNTGTGSMFYLANGGFQSAGTSDSRGYIYWPTTDTRRQITTWTRFEVARKIQFLYNHFGFIRRLVNGMSRMLGYLTPQPDTSDEEWNELAFETFMSIAGSAMVWDQAGKFDFFSGQIIDNQSIFRDSDTLAVKTLGPGGRARMAYYESHQIVNPPNSGTDWIDGVQVNRGRHIAYGIKDGDDPSQVLPIEAWKCIYMARFENRGQIRPLSILQSAVLNMIDVLEVRGFHKTKIKNASRMGLAIETDYNAPAGGRTGGFGSPVSKVEAIMPDGSTQQIDMELVLNGGMTPNLAPGRKVKVITDDSPSMNNQEFEKTLLKDCCNAADISYERLCDIAGITGPGIRVLNADDKRWVLLHHQQQAKRVHNQVVYTLAIEMDAGRLRQPKLKPGELWTNRFQYIGLAAPDIDGGRTAQATLSDLQSGQSTWLETWGQKGVYWKKAIRQGIAEVIFAEVECRLGETKAGLPPGTITPERVFPSRFGITSAIAPPHTSSATADPQQMDGDNPDSDNPAEATD